VSKPAQGPWLGWGRKRASFGMAGRNRVLAMLAGHILSQGWAVELVDLGADVVAVTAVRR
jgi:hypothetical protein